MNSKYPSNLSSFIKRSIQEVIMGFELCFLILLNKKNYYYFSSPPYITVLIASYFATLLRKKIILDIRDLYPEVIFEMTDFKEDSKIGKALIKLTKKIYNHSELILTTTQNHKNLIYKNYFLENSTDEKIKVLYNGFDPSTFDLNKTKIKKNSRFTLIFHGNLGKFQDIELILKIANHEKIREEAIRIFVVGSGPKEAEYAQQAPRNLKFLGHKRFEELPELIVSCHLGLSFRTNDLISQTSIPVKIFEYMSLGLPIIHTPQSEAGNIIKENKVGYVFNNEDLEAIVSKIIQLKNDQELYTKLSQTALWTSSKFNREKASMELKTYIEDIHE